jgi:hypothetical protein
VGARTGSARVAGARARAGTAAIGLAALVVLACAATPALAKPPKVRLTLTGPGGERLVEAADLRFIYFNTRYRRRGVSAEESPTRERLEVLSDRHDCTCVRFADYSKVNFKKLREIEIVVQPDSALATVRVTRLNGHSNAYKVDQLWGGGDLFPPHFAVVIDGVEREFPLRLGTEAGAAWPEEMLTRALLTTPPPPAHGHRH